MKCIGGMYPDLVRRSGTALKKDQKCLGFNNPYAKVFKISWSFQKLFLCHRTQTSHFDAWTYSRINSEMGMIRSASSLSLTFKLHKIMCAFILVNYLVCSHALPGVRRKSSMSKMSRTAGVGNLSISKLYWVKSICYWKCSTCKAFFSPQEEIHMPGGCLR